MALCLAACTEDKYVAEVTDLRLVRVDPVEGYAGSIVKVLGRNFSDSFGENIGKIGDVEATIIDFNRDQITVIAPDQALGTYPIEVTTPKGTISEERVRFTYKKKPERLYSVTTVAGNGSNSKSDGSGTSAAVGAVEGLCYAPDGKIWFCQRTGGSLSVRSFDPATTEVKTIASTLLPWGGGFDSKGDFYVAAKADNKVQKVTASGEVSDYSTGATLDNPMYVKFDSKDNMWIISRNSNTIHKCKDGVQLKSWTEDNYYPTCMYIDSRDRVFFASAKLYGIFMIDGDKVVRVAGSGNKPTRETFAESISIGNPLSAELGTIDGMFIARDNAIYFTDITTFTVMKLAPDASGDYSKGKISLIAGQPFSASVTNGKTDKAALKYPSGIVVSDDCKGISVGEATGYVIRMSDLT